MHTLLLVAGRSRRFWPLQEKSLFPIAGKPLIAHQIERLRAAGAKNITLVGGKHNLEMIQVLFPDIPTIEQENLDDGMQGALLSALPTLSADRVMVVSANDVVEVSAYKSVIDAASKKGIDGTLLARKVTQYFPGGYLNVEQDRITSIVEKPGMGNEPSDMVNIVAHVHNDVSALLEALRKTKNDSDDGYERAMASLFSTHRYAAVPYEGDWQAVKYAWHLLHLLPILLKDITPSIHPSAAIHPSAVVEGNVVIEEGVKILPHATVMGPCVIGAHTTIGNNALVRQSSVGRHCVIGYNTEVKGSVLADHVWTHSTYLGDSVIGENVSFGGGTVTGNLRLDEGEISSDGQDGNQIPTGLTKFGTIIGADTRLGIQVGTNPGVKIGSNVFIAGGTMVTQDISDNQFALMKEGKLTVKENKMQSPKPARREKYRQAMGK